MKQGSISPLHAPALLCTACLTPLAMAAADALNQRARVPEHPRRGHLLVLPRRPASTLRAAAAPRKVAAVSAVRATADWSTPTLNQSADASLRLARAPTTSPTHPPTPTATVQHRRCRFPSTPPPSKASTWTACSDRRLMPPARPRAPPRCSGALRSDHWRHPPSLRPVDVESSPPNFTAVDGLAPVSFSFPQPPESVLLDTAPPHLITDKPSDLAGAAARHGSPTSPILLLGCRPEPSRPNSQTRPK
jgi:hypothetical protein